MAIEIALGGVSEAADPLLRRIQYLVQLPAVGVAIANQQFAVFYSRCSAALQQHPRYVSDPSGMPGVIMKLHDRLAVLVIEGFQAPLFVVQQVYAIEIAVAEPDQP
ncbi:hypothetical protein D3C79_804440 [compost metagenome]